MHWLQTLGIVLTPYAWATHVVIGAVMQALLAAVLRGARVPHPWWFGAVLAIGYAWSREKTEFEFALKVAAHAGSLGPYWYRGFVPLEWDAASQWQFYAPAIATVLIALAFDHPGRAGNGCGTIGVPADCVPVPTTRSVP